MKAGIIFNRKLCLSLFAIFFNIEFFEPYVTQPGDIIDQHNDVKVYFNGDISNVFGRNMTDDGYNLGLKYQCVEFVKRYYYIIYNHKMPDSFGHAIDFFDTSIEDGALNPERALLQFRNGSISKPQEGDIIVFNSTPRNPYGHLGIITLADHSSIEIIQQNVKNKTRINLPLVSYDDEYYISNKQILGWLRLSDNEN